MPELPEVETVRAGLAEWVAGRTIATASFLHPRVSRRHPAGPADLSARLAGQTVTGVRRRGKYLWLELGDGPSCLVAHLGMSGQLLVVEPQIPDGPHLRARFAFTDFDRELRFVDQRTFGGLFGDELTPDGPSSAPSALTHIGRDPLDAAFDERAWIERTRRRDTTLKRALLDQSSISGIGNIYADEALWRAQLHGDRPTAATSRAKLAALLTEVRGVLTDALRAGGTSFDSLYVDVNGSSGYFSRSLNAYGQAGRPCGRCATAIVRTRWMNRSSYFCPRCQRPPRPPRRGGEAGGQPASVRRPA